MQGNDQSQSVNVGGDFNINSEEGKGQKLAKRAMNALKGMTAGLMETTKLVEVCGRLLPAIGLLFGL